MWCSMECMLLLCVAGFLCPVHTPDGTPCGLLNHMSASCQVRRQYTPLCRPLTCQVRRQYTPLCRPLTCQVRRQSTPLCRPLTCQVRHQYTPLCRPLTCQVRRQSTPLCRPLTCRGHLSLPPSHMSGTPVSASLTVVRGDISNLCLPLSQLSCDTSLHLCLSQSCQRRYL